MPADFCGAELAGIVTDAIRAIERSETPEFLTEWGVPGMSGWVVTEEAMNQIGPRFHDGYEAGRQDIVTHSFRFPSAVGEVAGPSGYWTACARQFARAVRWPRKTSIGAWMLQRLREQKETGTPDFFTLFGIQCGLFQIPLVQGAEGLLVALISQTNEDEEIRQMEMLPDLVSRIVQFRMQNHEPIFRAI